MADLREKYIEALNDIFGRYKASSTPQNVVAVGCLIPNAKYCLKDLREQEKPL